MVQELKTLPSIFGRLGQGLAEGLSEHVPKEIERARLAQGLKQLGEQKGLTPFEQFAGLASVPGAVERPQLLQTGGDLLRQQAYLEALKNQYAGQQGQKKEITAYVPSPEELNQPVKGEVPTLATPEATAESYKGFIPPTEQQERQDAFENFQKNPARYGFDFDKALEERKAITSRNAEIQKSYQEQEKIAVGKEEKVKTALQNEVTKLGLGNIPPKAYQKFEEKILNSILSKKEGGEGLSQEQAIKKHSKDLAQANRNYLDLGSLSAWSPLNFNRQVDALRKDFSSRGEQPMMMDQLISDYGISPLYAAHKTYPIKKGDIPTLNKLGIKIGVPTPSGLSIPTVTDLTYQQLKKEMGKSNSPLSIAYDLQEKAQDPRGWLKYLNNHRDDLEVWQADQLTKPINVLNLKDLWLRAWE